MNTIPTSDEVFQRILSDNRREDDQEMRKNSVDFSHLISPIQVYPSQIWFAQTVQALLTFQIHWKLFYLKT